MYNLREYYRLSEPPASPSSDRRAFDLATRGNSLDAEEAEGYKQNAYMANGFSALPSADPLETEMNADSLESGGGSSVHGSTLPLSHHTNSPSTSCPSSGPAGVSVFMRTVQPAPVKNAPTNRRTRQTLPSMISTVATSTSSSFDLPRSENSSSSNNNVVYSALHNDILNVVEMNTIIDPTQHLLAVLEQINVHSSFARDIALLKKKYELAVPPESRVQMTKQELLLLCATPTGSSDTCPLSTLL
eukprot:gene33185-37493_t